MKIVILLLPTLFLFLNKYTYATTEERIVNGTDALEGEFPFAVSLRIYDRHTCGATIINERFILTAAHCVCENAGISSDPSLYSIQYGSIYITPERYRVIDVKDIICNQFNIATLEYDSAILELESPIPDDGTWEPVKLSPTFDTSVEQTGVIIGWGRLSHNGPLPVNLQKLDVNIYDDGLCGIQHNLVHHICFGAQDGAGACNGDSGTALLVDNVQVGIASFISARCGIANQTYPNVYSRVSSYYDWIMENSML